MKELRTFLDQLFIEGEYHEIKSDYTQNEIVNTTDQAFDCVNHYLNRGFKNIIITPNGSSKKQTGFFNDKSIDSSYWYFCDMDFKSGDHDNNNQIIENVDQFTEVCLSHLEAIGFIPTLIIYTGGGVHLGWKLTENIGDMDKDQYLKKQKQVFQLCFPEDLRNRTNAENISKCHGLRVPSTFNYKPLYRDENGNPFKVELLECNDMAYDPDYIDTLIIKHNIELAKISKPLNDIGSSNRDFKQFKLFKQIIDGENLKKLHGSGTYTSRSEKNIAICTFCIMKQWTYDDVENNYEKHMNVEGNRYFDEGERRKKYLKRTYYKFFDETVSVRDNKFTFYDPLAKKINKNQLNSHFDEHFHDIMQGNIANIEKTLKLFINGYWKVVQESTIRKYIFEYFREKHVSLDIGNHVNELTRRTLELADNIIIPTQKKGEYRFKICISFPNGTLYIYPKEGRHEFKHEHHKEDYCLFQIQEPYTDDLFDLDFDNSYIGKYFKTYYSEKAQKFLQMFLASILIPGFKHEKAMYLVSINKGRNGKGTLCETVLELINDDSVSLVEMEQLEKDHKDDDLANSILNIGSEINERNVQNQKALKRAISCDPRQFKSVFERPFKARPLAKHVFTANKYPNVVIDKPLMDRIVFLKLKDVQHQPDVAFKEQFSNDKRFLLSFMLNGIYKLIDAGFKLPEGDDVAHDWFAQNETITAFFDEYIEVDPSFSCWSTDIYRVYESWYEKNQKNTKTNLLGDTGLTRKINEILGSQYEFIRKDNNKRQYDEKADKTACKWIGFRIKDDKTRQGKLNLQDFTQQSTS